MEVETTHFQRRGREEPRESCTKLVQCNSNPFLRRREINLQTLGQHFLKGGQRKLAPSGMARVVEAGAGRRGGRTQEVSGAKWRVRKTFVKIPATYIEKSASICSPRHPQTLLLPGSRGTQTERLFAHRSRVNGKKTYKGNTKSLKRRHTLGPVIGMFHVYTAGKLGRTEDWGVLYHRYKGYLDVALSTFSCPCK